MTLLAQNCKIPGMKKNFLFSLGLVMALVAPIASHAYIDRKTATVRIMNKAAGKVQQVNLPVGRTATFEKLDITVRACKQTDPFQAEDYFAFLEISKSGEGQIFGGWMSRNEPGDNPLQNADYDVWLVKCE